MENQTLTAAQRMSVLDQLNRIRRSEKFRVSLRMANFLDYVVRAELEGKGGELNQSLLAMEVFERDATFDPSIDSLVRVEAGRLRAKLGDYYREEGQRDPVIIELPKGRYNPAFQFVRESRADGTESLSQEIRFCHTDDGVSIAYALSGHGYPLVKAANWLSHLEFDGRSPVWSHWWRDLSNRYQLIRYDERGCGLSDWKVNDFSLDAWTRDLERVVEAVGVKKFALLGISQGAGVAIDYACRHPEQVSHLILYGGFIQGRLIRDASPEEKEKAELLKDLARVGWGGENAAFRKTFATLFVPFGTEEQFRAFDELQRVSTSAANASRFIDAFNHLDAVDKAPLVKAKTLVLHARNESEIPLSQAHLMAKLIPGARLITLESQNHILGETEPAWKQFLKEVDRFLIS